MVLNKISAAAVGDGKNWRKINSYFYPDSRGVGFRTDTFEKNHPFVACERGSVVLLSSDCGS